MTETPHAAELIAQAETATTQEELDAIEAQANDRVTVIDAVEARREELDAEPAQLTLDESTTQPEPATTEELPPPVEAPPVPESLAEQVQRQAHEVPESTGPSDWVPNRPNIRPPATEEIEEVPPEAETSV